MQQQLIEVAATIGLFALTTAYTAFKASDWYRDHTNIIERKIGDIVFASVARVGHEYVDKQKAVASTNSPIGQISREEADNVRTMVKQQVKQAAIEQGLPVPTESVIETHIEKALHRQVAGLKGAGA